MQLRIGFELVYSFPQPAPIILLVNIHDSRTSALPTSLSPITSLPSQPLGSPHTATPLETSATACSRQRAASASRPMVSSKIVARQM